MDSTMPLGGDVIGATGATPFRTGKSYSHAFISHLLPFVKQYNEPLSKESSEVMAHSKGRKSRRSKRTRAPSTRKQRPKHAIVPNEPSCSVEDLISRARELEEIGKVPEAIVLLEKAAVQRPKDSALCEEVALLYMQDGRSSDAETMFRTAIELQPGVGFEKYVCLSQLLGNTDEALALARKGIEIIRSEAMELDESKEKERLAELRSYEASAHCASAEICLGIIEDSNDPELARKMDADIEQSIAAALGVCEEGSGSEIEAMLSLANLRLSQGRRNEAVQSMKRVLLRMSEGLAVLETGDNSDETIMKGLSILPPLEIRIAAGKQFIEAEMWKPAISVLCSVMWECDFNVEVWYLLAVAYWKLGNIGEARNALESTTAVLRNESGHDGHLDEEMIDKLYKELDSQNARNESAEELMQE